MYFKIVVGITLDLFEGKKSNLDAKIDTLQNNQNSGFIEVRGEKNQH